MSPLAARVVDSAAVALAPARAVALKGGGLDATAVCPTLAQIAGSTAFEDLVYDLARMQSCSVRWIGGCIAPVLPQSNTVASAGVGA